MKKQIFITLLFLLSVTGIFAQTMRTAPQDVPSPYQSEVLKSFADSLYNDGFLSQAEGEYKRFLFSPQVNPDSLSYQTTLLSLSNIYKKQNNTNGIEWLRQNYYQNAQIEIKEKINFVQADFIFQTRNQQVFNLFTASFEQDKNNFSKDFINLINTSTLILNDDIAELKNQCAELALSNPDYEPLNQICLKYKKKSPGLALFLSTILPGSGKWYTGSFGAFTSSFLAIGSFAAGTVLTGIQTEWKSWQPYVFGSCGIILYIAELYGAYQSAKRYNTAQYRSLCEEAQKLYEKEY